MPPTEEYEQARRVRAQGDTVQGGLALGTVTLEEYRRIRAEKPPVHVVATGAAR